MKVTRMCAACREVKEKQQLLRIVKNKDGVVTDLSGKAPGRGAYICKNGECLKKAKKSRALERSLSCSIDAELYEKLEELIANEK
ncbi:MAG: YlxR family protein [Clostridia bacterium]|nr:YlxR family protein [Clostridia bacterium]